MVNPCKENRCGLRDEDKNNPTCLKCPDRIAYVRSVEGYQKLPTTNQSTRTCKTPGCNGAYYSKGYCKSCYHKAWYRKNKGIPEDAKLQRGGWRPRKKKPSSPTAKSFRSAVITDLYNISKKHKISINWLAPYTIYRGADGERK